MAVNMEQVDQLLRFTSTELEAHRKAAQMYARQLSPGLAIMKVINPSENEISAILRVLLDPNGAHSHGTTFLSSFLERFLPESLRGGELSGASVTLEARTDRLDWHKRRIDILVETPTLALGIENKPWAADQQEQISDYLLHLSKLNKERHHLLYISGDGSLPNEGSISSLEREKAEAANRFSTMGYADLHAWLSDAVRLCDSVRAAAFITDFITFIEEQFMSGSDVEQKDITDRILAEPGSFEASMHVADSVVAAKKHLWAKLCGQIEKELESKHGRITRFGDGSGSWTAVVIYPNGGSLGVCFEFQGAGFDPELIYGIYRARGGERMIQSPSEIQAALTSSLGAKQGKSDKWPWFRRFSAAANWKLPEPWKMIMGDQLAGKFVESAEAVCQALVDPPQQVGGSKSTGSEVPDLSMPASAQAPNGSGGPDAGS